MAVSRLEGVVVADEKYLRAPSILTESPKSSFHPKRGSHNQGQDRFIEGTEKYYARIDHEHAGLLQKLEHVQGGYCPSGFIHTGRVSPADVRLRQEAVREIVQRPKIRRTINEIVNGHDIFIGAEYRKIIGLCVTYQSDPDRVMRYLGLCERLQDANSTLLQRLGNWGAQARKMPLLNLLYQTHRKVDQRSLVAVYSERHRGLMLATIKPGVDPKDVFELISPEYGANTEVGSSGGSHAGSLVTTTGRRRRKGTPDPRPIVTHRFDGDTEAVVLALGEGRQRIADLNKRTADASIAAVFSTYAQLRELYGMAKLHTSLARGGYKPQFPEISDEPGTLHFDDMLPPRLVFDRHVKGPYGKNTLNLDGHQVVMVRGPSKRGKSEALRSVHTTLAMANLGGSVLAKNMVYHPPPRSHFIHCKVSGGYGGSELERNIHGVLDVLLDVSPGDTVILDELGDATNDQTAELISERIIDPLVANGCAVRITTHSEGVARYLLSKHEPLSLTTNNGARGKDRFKLVPCEGKVKYDERKVLDELRLHKGRVDDLLKTSSRDLHQVSATPVGQFRPREKVFGIPLDDLDAELRFQDQFGGNELPF